MLQSYWTYICFLIYSFHVRNFVNLCCFHLGCYISFSVLYTFGTLLHYIVKNISHDIVSGKCDVSLCMIVLIFQMISLLLTNHMDCLLMVGWTWSCLSSLWDGEKYGIFLVLLSSWYFNVVSGYNACIQVWY